MNPNRIIPPKHYRGTWPLDIPRKEIVRFCETDRFIYAYTQSGDRILCEMKFRRESDERP